MANRRGITYYREGKEGEAVRVDVYIATKISFHSGTIGRENGFGISTTEKRGG